MCWVFFGYDMMQLFICNIVYLLNNNEKGAFPTTVLLFFWGKKYSFMFTTYLTIYQQHHDNQSFNYNM